MVEVGVDVPQADVMVVANPERMGLSQLHQLRGRVGRGDKRAPVFFYIRVIYRTGGCAVKSVRENDDGFTIAKMDLSLRGPGEWLGVRQSGMPAMRVAKLPEDIDIAQAARQRRRVAVEKRYSRRRATRPIVAGTLWSVGKVR